MANSKRRLKEDAAHLNPTGYETDSITRLEELALHLQLRMSETRRLGLDKVRLDRIDYITADVLLDILTKVINAHQHQHR